DHPRARHHVAAADAVLDAVLLEVALGHRGDLDLARLDAELLDDTLRVALAVGVRRAVGHHHGEHVARTERARGERGADRGVDAAGEAEHGALEAELAGFALQEADEDRLDQRGLDVERVARAHRVFHRPENAASFNPHHRRATARARARRSTA